MADDLHMVPRGRTCSDDQDEQMQPPRQRRKISDDCVDEPDVILLYVRCRSETGCLGC